MPEGHPLRYRELIECLKGFGVIEIRSGRGSRRMLYKPDVEGLKQSYPIHVHSEHDEVDIHIIRAILRRFKIPEDEFWSGC